jgi:hypothetical protein
MDWRVFLTKRDSRGQGARNPGVQGSSNEPVPAPGRLGSMPPSINGIQNLIQRGGKI